MFPQEWSPPTSNLSSQLIELFHFPSAAQASERMTVFRSYLAFVPFIVPARPLRIPQYGLLAGDQVNNGKDGYGFEESKEKANT